MERYGIELIGVNAHTAEKLLFTVIVIVCFVIRRFILKALTQLAFSRYPFSSA